MTAMANEFGFNEKEKDQNLGANIAMGFFIVGGVASAATGYLADTKHRVHLFAATVICGECACLATYFSRTYPELLASRICGGIGVGGAAPVVFSIFADLYPNTARTQMATLIGISMSAGITLGQLLAGLVGPTYGWRLPFLIIATPAILNALAVLVLANEPERGSQEHAVIVANEVGRYQQDTHRSNSPKDAHSSMSPSVCKLTSQAVRDAQADTRTRYVESISWCKVRALLHTHTVALCYLQGVPGCMPWGMVYVFLNDYLSHDLGLGVHAATACMAVFGVGSVGGQLLGGWLGQRIYNTGRHSEQCLFMGAACMAGAIPVIFILEHGPASGHTGWIAYLGLMFVGGLAVSIPGPNVRAVLQNVCLPETRGTAFALFNLTDDIGKGGGPALVALLVHGLGGRR